MESAWWALPDPFRDLPRDSEADHQMPKIPGTQSPTPDPQHLASRSPDFALDTRFPNRGPLAGLRISRSSDPEGDSRSQPDSRSLAPVSPRVPKIGRPTTERPRMAGPCSRSGTLECAGSCWQDPLAEALSRGRPLAASHGRGCTRSRPLSVVYVLTREQQTRVEPEAGDEAEPLPLRCLREACAQLPGPRPRPQLRSLPFGTLALGDTTALDSFYNAGERAWGRGLGAGRSRRGRGSETPGRPQGR